MTEVSTEIFEKIKNLEQDLWRAELDEKVSLSDEY